MIAWIDWIRYKEQADKRIEEYPYTTQFARVCLMRDYWSEKPDISDFSEGVTLSMDLITFSYRRGINREGEYYWKFIESIPTEPISPTIYENVASL